MQEFEAGRRLFALHWQTDGQDCPRGRSGKHGYGIDKMTAQAERRFGIKNRGCVEAGCHAEFWLINKDVALRA